MNNKRRYKLHYNLKNCGNEVNAHGRSVTKRAAQLPQKEQEWCAELIEQGYLVSNAMFYPYEFKQKRNKNFGRKKL
jgi:hypothetical protein